MGRDLHSKKTSEVFEKFGSKKYLLVKLL